MAETLGALVKGRRGSASIRALAREAGVSYTYVGAIEDGRSWNLTVEAIAGLAVALNVTPEVVLKAALVSMRESRRGKV